MPDHPPERRPGPDAERPARTAPPTGRPARRACPRCGAALGALAASPGDDPESLYCGCCGLVVPASAE